MVPLILVGYVLQLGQTERSFIRHIDLTFSSPDGLDELISSGRIKLSFLPLSAGSPGVLGSTPSIVSLFNVLSHVGNQVKFDFGVHGIGGDRDSIGGDGYYTLELDLDNDGAFETTKRFYRLLGDADGSGTVVYSPAGDLGKDTNGDGAVNLTDTVSVSRSRNRTIGSVVVDPNY